jgi:hypothetical protein
MKKLALLILIPLLALPLSAFTQEKPPVRKHEIGLTVSNLNNFGIIYKTGRSNTLFRASLLALNLAENNTWGRAVDSLDKKGSNYGASMQAGFEHRINLVQNLQFLWGIEGGCGYSYNKIKNQSKNNTSEISGWAVTPRIAFVLGACYTVKESLVISLEISPYFGYLYSKENQSTSNGNSTVTTQSNFTYGLNSNSARFTIAYRFGK